MNSDLLFAGSTILFLKFIFRASFSIPALTRPILNHFKFVQNIFSSPLQIIEYSNEECFKWNLYTGNVLQSGLSAETWKP